MSRLDRIQAALDRHPARADAALAFVLFGLDVLTLWAMRSFEGQGWETRYAFHTFVLILPLIWRRRYPSAVILVMTAILVCFEVFDLPTSEWTLNAMLVALYSAGVYGDPRRTTPVRAITVTVFFGLVVNELFFAGTELPGNELLLQVLTIAANAVIVGATWWFGDSVRNRRLREAQLAERTSQLEHEREENARRAVMDERVRIARELHDVVAHHVSVMGIQAGAARRMLTKNPEKAEEALSAIEATSRTAVLELHRLLGFLRQETEQPVDLAPQPSLRQLDELIAQMREAGLPVEVRIEGEERPLSPGVDLSAYRIVQEALTNVLKHAGRSKAAVTIRYCPDAVDIEIVDDGRGPANGARAAEGGKGLIGMRERVSLLGGSLSVSQLPGVGYSVRAHLPLQEAPA